MYGIPLIKNTQTLMEIKTSGGYPFWMCHVLNDLSIFKASFTKYGSAYINIMNNKAKGMILYA